MRILFTTTPGRGHYHPMLGLATACRERGHEVAWAAHETACAQLRRAGFETAVAGLPEGITSAGLAERYPELMALAPADRPNFLFATIFGSDRAGPMLEDLLPIVETHDPSLLVCDQAELAGPIAAALVGIPNVTHGFGHPLPRDRVARAGDEMAGWWAAHGLEPRPYAGTYDHLYLDIYPESLKTNDSSHIAEIQQARPASAPAPEAPEPHWVDEGAPLIYVTFGTVFNSDIDVIRTVLEGIRELPVRVVITCGPGRNVRALGDQPANVHVADYIPQARLLPHCAAVASHAGSGTFLAALAAGLPELLLPRPPTSSSTRRLAPRQGSASRSSPTASPRAAVTDALAELLGDPAYRVAAQRLSAEIEAMPGPDAVAQELERRFA